MSKSEVISKTSIGLLFYQHAFQLLKCCLPCFVGAHLRSLNVVLSKRSYDMILISK